MKRKEKQQTINNILNYLNKVEFGELSITSIETNYINDIINILINLKNSKQIDFKIYNICYCLEGINKGFILRFIYVPYEKRNKRSFKYRLQFDIDFIKSNLIIENKF